MDDARECGGPVDLLSLSALAYRGERRAQDGAPAGAPRVADPLLVERVRQGDVDASLVLWQRHAGVARALAALSTGQPSDSDEVEDLVNRAFARVLREIARDHDPVAPFLLYLSTTLRLEAQDGVESPPAEPAVLRAFRRLRGRYQTLLWYSQVEPIGAESLGTVLGRDPDEVALGLEKATSRLRSEWIAETVADPTLPDTCAWVTLRVDAYDAAMLSELAEQRYIRHLNRCETCPSTIADLDRFPQILGTTVRRLVGESRERSTDTTPHLAPHRAPRPTGRSRARRTGPAASEDRPPSAGTTPG